MSALSPPGLDGALMDPASRQLRVRLTEAGQALLRHAVCVSPTLQMIVTSPPPSGHLGENIALVAVLAPLQPQPTLQKREIWDWGFGI